MSAQRQQQYRHTSTLLQYSISLLFYLVFLLFVDCDCTHDIEGELKIANVIILKSWYVINNSSYHGLGWIVLSGIHLHVIIIGNFIHTAATPLEHFFLCFVDVCCCCVTPSLLLRNIIIVIIKICSIM